MTTPGGHKHTNRLAQETSPYLLQHAHNPVDWMPWGPEAFARAKSEDKPLLVSVGYSTCHWCHVMERESFEDEEVAAAMNERFVCVKVDREERPDVDALTMTAVQAMSGHGGWPSTVFMTADQLPFFAGTYFPARDGDRGARTGFLTLVKRIGDLWRDERARVLESANDIAGELSHALRPLAPTGVPALDVVDECAAQVSARYDARFGGLMPAPKFPSSLPIRVLLRHHARTKDARALEMATRTFAKMSDGGMYDHVGGGFHRYSTDERWLVPHFEKMLYDNALLVTAGLELFQVTHDARTATVVKDVLAYVARDMTSPEGAFYSATDADSRAPSGHMEEGWYFTWTPTELRAELAGALSPDAIDALERAWGITERGNFEGRNIPWLGHRDARPTPAEEDAIARARPVLLKARNERPLPLRDDKVIAAWNGLMISAFARAAFVFGDDALAQIAVRALDFVLTKMRAANGRLHRTFKDGRARHLGMLDDHAHICAACVDVFETTGDTRFLDEARAIERTIADAFEDEERGGFFATPHDNEQLLVREKPTHDGSEPSGASVHALTLIRLATLLDDEALLRRAERTVASVGQVLERHPLALSEMLLAVEALHARRHELVVIAGEGERALVDALRTRFVPHGVRVHAREGSALALAHDKRAIDGKATLYVCERGACQLPITRADDVRV
jgi:uncharacterized protein YyaL (SSP411 family)